jgi:hypothetical protein
LFAVFIEHRRLTVQQRVAKIAITPVYGLKTDWRGP